MLVPIVVTVDVRVRSSFSKASAVFLKSVHLKDVAMPQDSMGNACAANNPIIVFSCVPNSSWPAFMGCERDSLEATIMKQQDCLV